jgi:hypothetical protein
MRTARLGAYSGDPGSIGAGQSEAKAKCRAKGGVQKRLPWVTILLYPTASEREECMLAMLFWVFAALAVVGALAIVWGLYLLARRWL